MLVYRPALSAFNAVYRFSRMADRMCWFLWASVRVELECVMGLAPLLWASMKNPWFTRVPCTSMVKVTSVVAEPRGLGHHSGRR